MTSHSSRPHPQSPNQLVGSSWTRAGAGAGPLRHFEVVAHNHKTGMVTLRPALEPDAGIELPWRELRDRARWSPGWLSLVGDGG